jgi:hypothetical protein
MPEVRPCLPITNADEDALRAARPRVAVWVDKLRRAGHVVFVRKVPRGAKPNEGFRIDVDGRSMSVWELWAWFSIGTRRRETPHVAELDAVSRTHHRRRLKVMGGAGR